MTKTNRIDFPATLLCDFYKVSHRTLYPTGTEFIYSTFTPRSSKHGGNVKHVVAFGIQGFVKKYLIDYFNDNFFNRPVEDVLAEYERVIKYTLGEENPDSSHIEELHKLGYLPIELKSLPEGALVPIKVPMLTIENTHKDFFWLTNYLETLLSTELWQPVTSATKAYEMRKVLDKYAFETVGNNDFVKFASHDFSMRGMSSLETAQLSGAGHLLSFVGTDTIPAILYLEKYYNADIENELVGCSVKATEHSIQCAYGRDEMVAFTQLLEKNPTGILSIVSDTYDFWGNVEYTLPALKDKIMARDGKIVIRPDSGVPEDILCGEYIPDLTDSDYPDTTPEDMEDYFRDEIYNIEDLCGDGYTGDSTFVYKFKLNGKYYKMTLDVEYDRHDKRYYYIYEVSMRKVEEFIPTAEDLGLVEALWSIFGGTVNSKGYKELDSHIGAIYGDSINLIKAAAICERLKQKGFASSNVVLGTGSFYYQYNTRDTFGFAMKATWAQVNGEERLLFKDPKTDDGTKKSQRGRVVVYRSLDDDIKYVDGLTKAEQETKDIFPGGNLLQTIFKNGELVHETSLAEIRERLSR